MISSVIFWGSSNPAFSISYTDSLFLAVSAMTEAGLNTVNLSQMTTWQQTILFLLIIFGSSIWVSIWTVLARKHVFEQRFHEIVKAERARKLERRQTMAGLPLIRRLSMSISRSRTNQAVGSDLPATDPRTKGAHESVYSSGPNALNGDPSSSAHYPGSTSNAACEDTNSIKAGDGPVEDNISALTPPVNNHVAFAPGFKPEGSDEARSSAYSPQRRPTRRPGPSRDDGNEKEDASGHGTPRLFRSKTVGRNGQFHDLTSEEREHLGGCEYRALKVLAVIVPLYFFLWQFLGCIAIGAWMHINQPETALANGITPWWLGIFNGASAFNNSGMSLLDANMIPFETSYFVLITMGLMILAGNTAYPIFLRLIIWSLLKILTSTTDERGMEELKETLTFILKYPRRVYTNLFPSRPTYWLLFMLILLNSVDWASFELLNLGNPVVESIPRGARVLDGLFQALGE